MWEAKLIEKRPEQNGILFIVEYSDGTNIVRERYLKTTASDPYWLERVARRRIKEIKELFEDAKNKQLNKKINLSSSIPTVQELSYLKMTLEEKAKRDWEVLIHKIHRRKTLIAEGAIADGDIPDLPTLVAEAKSKFKIEYIK